MPNIRNGQSILTKSNFGDVVTYECNENYILLGTATHRCLPNNTWSGQLPECISNDFYIFCYIKHMCEISLFISVGVLKCARLMPSLNTKLIYGNEHGPIHNDQQMFPVGTLVEFECTDNLVLMGESLLTCVDGGIWDLPMPKCVIHTTTLPPAAASTPTISISTHIATATEHDTHLVTYSDTLSTSRPESTFSQYSPTTADKSISLQTDITDDNSADLSRATNNPILQSASNSYGCSLESLPKSNPNTFISEVIEDNRTILEAPDRISLKGHVHARSRVYYACLAGFQYKGEEKHYAECNDDFSWITYRSICHGSPILLFNHEQGYDDQKN